MFRFSFAVKRGPCLLQFMKIDAFFGFYVHSEGMHEKVSFLHELKVTQ